MRNPIPALGKIQSSSPAISMLAQTVFAIGLLAVTSVRAADNENLAATNRMDATTQNRRGRFGGPERGVYKAQVTPHWFQENSRFWYRNDLRDGAKEFVVVDAEHG